MSTDPLNSKRLTAAVAFGFASIALALLADPLLGRGLPATYHWSGTASALFLPILLFTLLLWVVLSLLLWSARGPGRWRVLVWSGLLLPAPWVIFRIVVLRWGAHVPTWVHVPGIATAAWLWLLILLFWRPAFTARSEQIIRSAASVLVYLGLSGVLLLAAVLHAWWAARHLNGPLPQDRQASSTLAASHKPRILWIVLDELSYDQIFDHRFAGLQLPAFDALTAEATVFTHVVPTGLRTERVMPSLFTGRPVDDIHASPAGMLLIPDPATGRWTEFNQHATVFQDALHSGYRTGVAGWYNPYCRILPAVVLDCAWSDDAQLIDGIAWNGTLVSNLLSLVQDLLGNVSMREGLGSVLPSHKVAKLGQIADCRNLIADGDRLLADPSADFVLLHLPFPHPPGYFNRATGQLTTKKRSYLDNLVLADDYLAHVRSLLTARGDWDSTTVLVMGDHSWRTNSYWRNGGDWTPEEEQASTGGRFDDRPAYLLKLRDQRAGARIDLPFDLLDTRHLLDALFAHQIRTPEDLEGWVQQIHSGRTGQTQAAARGRGSLRLSTDLRSATNALGAAPKPAARKLRKESGRTDSNGAESSPPPRPATIS